MSDKMNGMQVTAENEVDLIQGLLHAADYKNDEEMQKTVEIKRNGKVYFYFKIRPLGEEELLDARKKAAVMMPNPANPKLPPVEKEVRLAEFSAWKIYYATVEPEKVWDAPEVIQGLKAKGFSVLRGIDVINTVLRAGEKDKIDADIDKLSGFYDTEMTEEEYAKN